MTIQDKYDPDVSEKKWREYWEKEKVYAYQPGDSTNTFSVDTPPPTVSGRMHIGHAFSYSQQDFVVRFKRMRGYNVFYPFGTDDNGLATEKLVQKTEKVNLRKISRDKAIETCLKFLEKERPKFVQDWKNIGMSCDFSLSYSTIDKHSRKISQATFLRLAKKNVLYRKEGPVMWDRVFQSAISQAELEDKKKKSFLCYLRAKVSGTDDTYFLFATTRPEMVFACVGMSVQKTGKYVKVKHGNEFYILGKETLTKQLFGNNKITIVEEISGKNLINTQVKIPVSGNVVSVSHDEIVQSDFGTGIVYFCTFGGIEDVEWWAKRKEVDAINTIGKDGRLNSLCFGFENMFPEDARKKIIEKLETNDDCLFKKEIENVVNVGERSGIEIEYIISKQWYVKYLDKKEAFLEAGNKLNWHPLHMKTRLDNWIKGLNWDWSVSRQRYFGVPIPVWYDKEGKIYYADEKQLPVDPMKDRPLNVPDDLELVSEIDVLDTWFTSASTPLLASSLLSEKENILPMDLRPQAHDIINFWLFYTLAKTQLLTGENPWKDVSISGWALDPHGKKMSKSKGNVVVPQEMIKKYSADALRFWAAGSKLGDNMPFQEKDLVTGKKIVTKLWNASKFIFMHFKPSSFEKHDLGAMDKWILTKINTLTKICTEYFDNYEYAKAKLETEKVFWHVFCDNYLEFVKDRIYNPDKYEQGSKESALFSLYESLFILTKLFAPFIPFITEEIYQQFFIETDKKKSVHVSSWPVYNENFVFSDEEIAGDIAVGIVSLVRKHKSKLGVSLKTEISSIVVECKEFHRECLALVLEDIKATGRIKDVVFGKGKLDVIDGFKISINS